MVRMKGIGSVAVMDGRRTIRPQGGFIEVPEHLVHRLVELGFVPAPIEKESDVDAAAPDEADIQRRVRELTLVDTSEKRGLELAGDLKKEGDEPAEGDVAPVSVEETTEQRRARYVIEATERGYTAEGAEQVADERTMYDDLRAEGATHQEAAEFVGWISPGQGLVEGQWGPLAGPPVTAEG